MKLADGREIKGIDLRVEGDLYMLTIAGGATIPVHRDAVVEVIWTEEGGDRPGAGASRGIIANMVTGRSDDERREVTGRATKAGEAESGHARGAAADEAGDATGHRARAGGIEPLQNAVASEVEPEDRGQGQPSSYAVDSQGIRIWSRGQVLAGADIRPPTTAEQLAVFGEPAKFAPDVVHFDLKPSYWTPDPNQANWSPSVFPSMPRNDTWTPTDGFAQPLH